MPTATNEIRKRSLSSLGYGFVAPQYLPAGKDEYYLREMQNKNGINYRQLSAYEIEVLVRNRNTSENWNRILVSDAFNPELVKNCKFFGLVRIGKLEPYVLEFSDLKVPVGLYNSTIISSDFGDNVVIDNVNYLSHYIIGNEVIITNVNELVTSDHCKFGNGILKEGEDEDVRIWLELCNENGGRKVLPFNGMMPGDAYLWTKFRDDEVLMQKFQEFTERKFDKKRGYYGKIGDRTVIKNCRIVKDVWIGTDAYLKGANKLKNLTVNSGPEGKSQIGEGCELVNGIIGYGCRAFYGVKAVRFVMASHSSLKYGARLINSYLGDNSTISCCEVLNSLIFPAHEQHHNNSFLTAATVMGQSNMAAGATIGSNHNSRSADGELVAGRGFWPGLCVSLKHNSKFATFSIIAKGDYPAELNIPIPFSLTSNDVTNNRLVIMPGYWFMHNMYALERNGWKYQDRDKRQEKIQHLENNYLAPDSISEIAKSLKLLQNFTGKAWYKREFPDKEISEKEAIAKGKKLLEDKDPVVNELEILAEGFENTKRKVVIIKVLRSYQIFNELIQAYCVNEIITHLKEKSVTGFENVISSLPAKYIANEWMNVGGQLIPESEIKQLIKRIHSGKIKSWDELHEFYKQQESMYCSQKLSHALAIYFDVFGVHIRNLNKEQFKQLIASAIITKEWMTDNIYQSRAKDYINPFRKMSYNNQEEMDAVVGKLEDNSFIKKQRQELVFYKKQLLEVISIL
jgi:NDP-sugar pyrophosphorylase family protein